MSRSTILFVAPAQTVTALFPKLKEEGVEAGIADSLKGALGYVQKNKPGLVFTKTRMPGFDARDLLDALGQDGTRRDELP